MEEHEVVLCLQQGRVLRRRLDVGPALVLGELLRRALETVVDLLGHREEALVASDDLPVRHEAERVEHRDSGAEQLRYPSSVGCRVDVEHPGPAQPRRDSDEAVQDRVRGYAAVGLDGARTDVDQLEHRVHSTGGSGVWVRVV